MKTPNQEPEADLQSAVAAARKVDGLFDKVEQLYAELDRITAQAKCNACGACCDFDTFGHRLYLSTIELAYLLEKSENPQNLTDKNSNLCPWQVENLCTARDGRAIGCRVFNCHVDPDSENAIYEQFHQRILALHQEFHVPYMYIYLPNAARDILGQ